MSNKDEAEKKPTKNPNQPELAKHDASILDLAFVMDCTGSMGSYIQNATEVIQNNFMICLSKHSRLVDNFGTANQNA